MLAVGCRHVEAEPVDGERRRIGEHAVQWRGTDASGGRVSTGVYFYRLTAGSLVETKRMTLIK